MQKQKKANEIVLENLKRIFSNDVLSEYRFKKKRKWRVDFFIPSKMLAIELEGGIFIYGRHNRAIGFLKDLEKYNQLALQDIKLYRIPSHDVYSRKLLKYMQDLEHYANTNS